MMCNSRWSAEELLEHPFVHHKAYVYLYERELSQICDKILHYFRQYPDRTTPHHHFHLFYNHSLPPSLSPCWL